MVRLGERATDLLTRESNSANRRPQPRQHRRRGKRLTILLAAGTLIVGWILAVHWARHNERPITVVAPVPVTATIVGRSDVPIAYEDLGTKQAFNTVSIRTRVDGQIVSINFKEGQAVHAGDVLAQIDPRSYLAQLEPANAKLVQGQYQLQNSKLDLWRYRILLRKDDTLRQQVAAQEAQVGTQEGLVGADQAQIDSAQVSLSYTTIRSPITGQTGIRQVDIGNIVHTTDSTPIVVVTQLQPISVLFTLPEQDLSAIQDRQDAQASPLTVMALDGQSGRVIDQGTLQLVDNEIDQTTGTIKLKANFPNPKNRLWPGEFVTARLVLDIRHDGTTCSAQWPKAVAGGRWSRRWRQSSPACAPPSAWEPAMTAYLIAAIPARGGGYNRARHVLAARDRATAPNRDTCSKCLPMEETTAGRNGRVRRATAGRPRDCGRSGPSSSLP